MNPEGLVFARLADAYRRCGRLERALELLREGLERHPDYTTAHLIQARTLREADRPEEAARSFRRVLQLDAENLVALRSLAELAAERGEVEEAHRWADRLHDADPFTSFSIAEVTERAREASSPAVDEPPEGDGEGPARSGAPGPPGLPGEEGLASEIAAMADEQWWTSDAEEPPPDDDGGEAGTGADSDVATETMAHLYAQQGLYEEAADVYRRLLERRPGDEELRRRLEEMAGRAAGAAEPPAPEAGAAEEDRDPEEAPDAEDEQDGNGPSVSAREHFRALLHGRARAGSAESEGVEEAEEAREKEASAGRSAG